ncbi:hypothetical protein GY45DRAFT_1248736, partial [Cubamyces sp. BRFM 1775]
LAYVEWFTPFAAVPHPDYGLYKVTHCIRRGTRLASIIPVDSMKCSCHLYPDFGTAVPQEWTSSNVLDRCSTFYVNVFTDHNTYKLLH